MQEAGDGTARRYLAGWTIAGFANPVPYYRL
jgi:hypothetical protein